LLGVREVLGFMTVPGARELISNRPPNETFPSPTAGDRGTVSRDDFAGEIEALAALLAEVVELAGNRAMYPGRLDLIAELARGHESVRRALREQDPQ
jgi:hypothetical protein